MHYWVCLHPNNTHPAISHPYINIHPPTHTTHPYTNTHRPIPHKPTFTKVSSLNTFRKNKSNMKLFWIQILFGFKYSALLSLSVFIFGAEEMLSKSANSTFCSSLLNQLHQARSIECRQVFGHQPFHQTIPIISQCLPNTELHHPLAILRQRTIKPFDHRADHIKINLWKPLACNTNFWSMYFLAMLGWNSWLSKNRMKNSYISWKERAEHYFQDKMTKSQAFRNGFGRLDIFMSTRGHHFYWSSVITILF